MGDDWKGKRGTSDNRQGDERTIKQEITWDDQGRTSSKTQPSQPRKHSAHASAQGKSNASDTPNPRRTRARSDPSTSATGSPASYISPIDTTKVPSAPSIPQNLPAYSQSPQKSQRSAAVDFLQAPGSSERRGPRSRSTHFTEARSVRETIHEPSHSDPPSYEHLLNSSEGPSASSRSKEPQEERNSSPFLGPLLDNRFPRTTTPYSTRTDEKLEVSGNTAIGSIQINAILQGCTANRSTDWIAEFRSALKITDPNLDRRTIQNKNIKKCKQHRSEIQKNKYYRSWNKDTQNSESDKRLFWIYNVEATSEMTVGLLDALEIDRPSSRDILSYYFPFKGELPLNKGVSVLKGLIYHLLGLRTKESLNFEHLWKYWEGSRKPSFDDHNAMLKLWDILADIVAALSPRRVYLVIQIHEWDPGSYELLSLVFKHCASTCNVRWSITSQDYELRIEKRLREASRDPIYGKSDGRPRWLQLNMRKYPRIETRSPNVDTGGRRSNYQGPVGGTSQEHKRSDPIININGSRKAKKPSAWEEEDSEEHYYRKEANQVEQANEEDEDDDDEEGGVRLHPVDAGYRSRAGSQNERPAWTPGSAISHEPVLQPNPVGPGLGHQNAMQESKLYSSRQPARVQGKTARHNESKANGTKLELEPGRLQKHPAHSLVSSLGQEGKSMTDVTNHVSKPDHAQQSSTSSTPARSYQNENPANYEMPSSELTSSQQQGSADSSLDHQDSYSMNPIQPAPDLVLTRPQQINENGVDGQVGSTTNVPESNPGQRQAGTEKGKASNRRSDRTNNARPTRKSNSNGYQTTPSPNFARPGTPEPHRPQTNEGCCCC